MNVQNDDLQSAQQLAKNTLKQGAELESDEVTASDQIAETLGHLQAVIERNAHQLEEIQSQLREKRESLRSIFDSDAKLVEAEAEVKKLTEQFGKEKSRIQSSPTSLALKTQLADLRQQQKEIEETLNSHLLNYYQLTNSTSFDTSDGDQWDFKVQAKLKKH